MKSYRIASSVGTVALLLAGAAQAEPSKAHFDNWTVTGGTISAGCATGAGNFTSCGTAISEKGFFSRLVVDQATGKQFFQTIVTMPDANAANPAALENLAFANENFVSFSGSNGILDKQRIFQAQVVPPVGTGIAHTVNFTNASTIGTGWAKDFVELKQAITAPTVTAGDGFETHFLYKQVGYNDPTTSRVPTGKGMKITSFSPIGSVPSDGQNFVLVDKQGDYVVQPATPNTIVLTGPTGGTLTWVGDSALGVNTGTRGANIQAIYIGQDSATAGLGFGFSTYANMTVNPVNKIAIFDLVKSASVGWSDAIWGSTVTKGPITDIFLP